MCATLCRCGAPKRQVPGFKEVDEEYTTVEHRSVMRDKEVWVKKVVQEEVMEPYEVRRTRKKRVPTSSLKEVEEWQEVTVTTDQAVEQDGFRVDEVEDTKLLEVKEEQLYELVPRLKDERILMSARYVPLANTRHFPPHCRPHPPAPGAASSDALPARVVLLQRPGPAGPGPPPDAPHGHAHVQRPRGAGHRDR